MNRGFDLVDQFRLVSLHRPFVDEQEYLETSLGQYRVLREGDIAYSLALQYLCHSGKVFSSPSKKSLSLIRLRVDERFVPFGRSQGERTSSQQSSMALTHSSRLGGHIACMSPRYSSGPPANTDSLALRFARDRRDMDVERMTAT